MRVLNHEEGGGQWISSPTGSNRWTGGFRALLRKLWSPHQQHQALVQTLRPGCTQITISGGGDISKLFNRLFSDSNAKFENHSSGVRVLQRRERGRARSLKWTFWRCSVMSNDKA